MLAVSESDLGFWERLMFECAERISIINLTETLAWRKTLLKIISKLIPFYEPHAPHSLRNFHCTKLSLKAYWHIATFPPSHHGRDRGPVPPLSVWASVPGSSQEPRGGPQGLLEKKVSVHFGGTHRKRVWKMQVNNDQVVIEIDMIQVGDILFVPYRC